MLTGPIRGPLLAAATQVVTCIQWLPHKRGCLAVACAGAATLNERAAKAGCPAPAHVLIWSFRDPIRPESVLESPHEVFTLQVNPSRPDVVAGGCYNGQVWKCWLF